MAYTTTQARQEFDGWSERYDRDPLQRFLFQPSHRMLLGSLVPGDRRVLDVGCGTGQFAYQVRRIHPVAEVVGLDLSAGMLARGRERCQEPLARVRLVRGDSQRLPFRDDSFDVVTCAHSFHHYPDQARVVREMHRVLRPGGRLMILDGDRDRWWGRLLFDGLVVMLEGAVRHLSGTSFWKLFERCGFDHISQRRHGGPLPFLMTTGFARKPHVPEKGCEQAL
jgi:ubiquinone/menaquinone biosynthesis C-methylase UbiE